MIRDEAGSGPRPTGAVGPVRGVYRPSRRFWVFGALAMVVLVVGYAFLRGGATFVGHWFVSSWVPWVLVLAVPAIFAVHSASTVVSAGDTWLYVRELGPGRWVALDQLTEVTVSSGANSTLRLRDWQGRKVVVSIDNVRRNPAIWSAVQAGVSRARARGNCRTNRYTAVVFGEGPRHG